MIQPSHFSGLLLLATVVRMQAAIINLDYSYDIADGGNFFGSHPEAKATLERAASDVGAVITSSLGAIGTDVFNGTQGGSSASIDWSLSFQNPVTSATVTLNTFSFPGNSITIYVGMRPLSGSTLGNGGPAGSGVGLSAGGPAASAAFTTAQNNSNSTMSRQAGPTIATLTGTFVGVNYSLSYGALAGKLSFDNDVNNDGIAEDFTALNNYWHFDLSSPQSGQNDFYSVAVHEILHSIGVGTSATWNSKVSGNTWSGSNAQALNGGTGANLVNVGHILEGVMSTSIVDGSLQEAIMDPTLTIGTRKYMTEMDLAFLRDIGYSTVPEPSQAASLAGASLLFFCLAKNFWRRRTVSQPN